MSDATYLSMKIAVPSTMAQKVPTLGAIVDELQRAMLENPTFTGAPLSSVEVSPTGWLFLRFEKVSESLTTTEVTDA